jgi:subfamily B ATP-binding cassette protein MsbA
VLEPWPVKIVIDGVVQHKTLPRWLDSALSGLFGHNEFAILNFAVAAVALIAVVGAISSYGEKYLTTSISQWITHDLRRTIYNHLQHLSLAEYDLARTGDLITRVTSDIGAIQDFVNSALLGLLINSLTLVSMVAVMWYVNWRFTLIALSVVPALSLVVYSLTRRIKAASRDVRKQESELVSIVEEVLSSARVVKAFAREDYESQRFESQSLANVEAALQARNLKAKLSPLVGVIVACGTCLVLGYGGRLVVATQLSPGMLVVFLLYLSRMYKPLRDLSKMTDTVSKAWVGHERIRELLEIESHVYDLPRARSASRFKGRIEFEHVTFGYGGRAHVLHDVSFRIEAGQVAAFVGASGTGKTTIASLIPRFYDPLSGQVKIDGVDIRRFTLKSLREQISFVLQDPWLFRATIWENITYGKPDASPAEILRAAQLAGAHEFITELPAGYDTVIGERGGTLSGGERQRISIARAIIRNAPILILDEPTTGLDATTEQTVIQALSRLMKDRTCVVIAHDLQTVEQADVIFVLKDADLAELGTHDQLLAAGGVYSDMYHIQNGTRHHAVTSQGIEG